MLCVGQVYESKITLVGAAVPPSTATLTITLPDQSVQTLTGPWTWTPSGSDLVAVYDYVLPTPGLFSFAWTTQGPGTSPRPEFVNVEQFISIVSTAQVMAHLNKVKDTDYDELGQFMMAATELVEAKIGPCVPRQFTDRVEASARQVMELAVPHAPVIAPVSVTSVWAGGPAWDASVLAADKEAGIIYQPGGWAFWWGPWDVVYTAGRSYIAARWQHAALEQIRHLWETQRGSMPPAILQGEEVFTATTGFSFSVPRRVLELLEQDMVPSL